MDVRVITQFENRVKQGESFLNTGKSKNLSPTQNLECLTLKKSTFLPKITSNCTFATFYKHQKGTTDTQVKNAHLGQNGFT